MPFASDGLSLALYAIVAVSGLALLFLRHVANRGRRNAGFASKAQLKRQLSAKSALRASEIRPSLADRGIRSRPTADLSKRPRSRAS